MRTAWVRMVAVAVTTLALYLLTLLAADTLGLDIRQPLPIAWSGAFAVAVAFAGWNVWDSLLDARAAYTLKRPQRTIAGGIWRLRSDLLQGACCTAMLAAGMLAIVQVSTPEVRAAVIFVASLTLVANQLWNRLDRERIMRMPSPAEDARYHAAQATIRRLEADIALQRADKHDALQRAASERGVRQILERLLIRHGVEVPAEFRTAEGSAS